MAVFKTAHATGQAPVVSLNSALVQCLMYEYTTGAVLAANDIIEMGPLEANVQPVDVMLVTDDLDTSATPAMTLSVGILNAAGTDIDAAATATWIAASTAAQTGGVARSTTANCYLTGRSAVARKIGVKVVAGAATYAGAGKKLAVVLRAAG